MTTPTADDVKAARETVLGPLFNTMFDTTDDAVMVVAQLIADVRAAERETAAHAYLDLLGKLSRERLVVAMASEQWSKKFLGAYAHAAAGKDGVAMQIQAQHFQHTAEISADAIRREIGLGEE